MKVKELVASLQKFDGELDVFGRDMQGVDICVLSNDKKASVIQGDAMEASRMKEILGHISVPPPIAHIRLDSRNGEEKLAMEISRLASNPGFRGLMLFPGYFRPFDDMLRFRDFAMSAFTTAEWKEWSRGFVWDNGASLLLGLPENAGQKYLRHDFTCLITGDVAIEDDDWSSLISKVRHTCVPEPELTVIHWNCEE